MNNIWAKIRAVKWYVWVLYVLIILLLWMVFRGCNKSPSNKQDMKSVDSAFAAHAADKKADMAKIAALTADNQALQAHGDTLTAQREALKKDLSERKSTVLRLLAAGEKAKRDKDTGAIIANNDTLRKEVGEGLPVLATNDSAATELINTLVQEGAIKDSIASIQAERADKAEKLANYGLAKYEALNTKYEKQRFQLTFNKTLSRIEAAALLVAVAKIFIFK